MAAPDDEREGTNGFTLSVLSETTAVGGRKARRRTASHLGARVRVSSMAAVLPQLRGVSAVAARSWV